MGLLIIFENSPPFLPGVDALPPAPLGLGEASAARLYRLRHVVGGAVIVFTTYQSSDSSRRSRRDSDAVAVPVSDVDLHRKELHIVIVEHLTL